MNNIKNLISNGNIIFYIFLIGYSSYLIFLANNLVLSWDEPCSLYTSENLYDVFSLSYGFEGQPPGYFTILSLWRKINGGIFFARFLSIIFTLLSAFFLYRIIRIFFDEIQTNWVVVLFLLNPYTVKYSMEIRLYSMLILLTLIACYIFYLIYFRDQKKYKIVFILIGLIGIYTQYYFAFIIISFSLVLLYIYGWKSFKDFVLLALPIALLTLPNLVHIEEGFRIHNNTKIDYTINERVLNIFGTTSFFYIPGVDVTLGKLLKWIFRIMFILLFSHSLVKLYNEAKLNDNFDAFREIKVVLLIIIILMTLFILVFTLTDLIFANYYLTIIFPFICVSFIVFGIYNKIMKNIIYGLLTSYFILALFITYRPPYIKNDNSKAVAELIQKVEKPNEPILFYFNYRVLPFQYYYTGENILKPIPKLIYDNKFYDEAFSDTTELNTYIKQTTSDVYSFFLITGNDPGFITTRKLTNQLIDTYLENNFIITKDTTFHGIQNYHELRLRHLFKSAISDN